MRIANVEGRGSLVIDGRIVDVETATSGRNTSDPMELVDLRNHPLMADLAADEDCDQVSESSLGPPVPRPRKNDESSVELFLHWLACSSIGLQISAQSLR